MAAPDTTHSRTPQGMVDSSSVITLSVVVVTLFIVAVLVLSPACTRCQNINFIRKFPRADLGDGEGMSLFGEPGREVHDGGTQVSTSNGDISMICNLSTIPA